MVQQASKSLSRRGRFWLRHVRQWRRSNTTQTQYCSEHHLSVAAFRWWKRTFIQDQRLCESPSGPAARPETTFTEIRLPCADWPSVYPYEIVLPNGTQLRLPRDFDAEGVHALVSLLVAPC